MDAETEKLLLGNLERAFEGKTRLSIAHRLGTVQASDLIVVMKDGKVVEEGGFNDLMEQRQHFYALAHGE